MRKLVPLILVSIHAITPISLAQGEPIDPTFANGVEALVNPQAQAELVSGVILVTRGDSVLFQGTYGFANWELRTPILMSTRFGIASLTKVMTVVLAEILTKADRIDGNSGCHESQRDPGFQNHVDLRRRSNGVRGVRQRMAFSHKRTHCGMGPAGLELFDWFSTSN